MAKKVLLVLVLAVFIAGGVFAQTDFAGMAKNTITVDLFPTIEGLAIGAIGDMIGGGSGLSSSGFGIAAQYERQLAQKFGVAARFFILTGGVGYADKYTDTSQPVSTEVSTNLGIDITSFAIEGHARFYPWGKTFFLDGMLGYANMAVKFSGEMVGKGTDPVTGKEEEQGFSVNINPSQGFFTLGAKLGWRISFGRNGGFTFEPALGYRYGIGFGDTVVDQLSKKMKDEYPDADMPVSDVAPLFGIIQDMVFVGGPYLSLAFGWRF